MQLNRRSRDLIIEFEGLRLKAYNDGVGVITIGIGTTVYPDGRKVRLGDTCSTQQALDYLAHDIETIRFPALAKLVQAPLNENETGALISLIYNIGVDNFRGSTLRKLLNQGAPRRDVAARFASWNKGGGRVMKGLVRRRAAEAKLFLEPVEVPKKVA